MDKVSLNLLVALILIILALCCYFIFLFFHRYIPKVKAENLERDKCREAESLEKDKHRKAENLKKERHQENEVIQQYSKIKNNYFSSIARLKNEPTNTHLRTDALKAGQKLIEFTKQHTKYASVQSFNENTLLSDIPGRTDPLFIDALRVCKSLEHINTYLLKIHLQIDREIAETIMGAMVQEGFLGEAVRYGDRPVLISSMGRLKKRINEAKVREKEENEIFQVELLRLTNSGEYKYIDQFAKKYGRNISVGELTKLQDLLSIRGFEFSEKQMTDIVNLALNQQRHRDAKSKILNEEPNSVQDIVKTYLNFDQSEDSEMFEVLKEIIEEKGFYDLFENNPEKLREEVEKIKKEIELELFEKRLLEDDQGIHLEEIDQLDGYDFEEFLTNLFSKMGYQVEQTRLSGDQGADLVVVKFGEKKVIQAKRFGGKVGNKAVQEIVAAISLYKAQKGIVITNNYFTPAAVELANANNIELIDRNALEELINKHW